MSMWTSITPPIEHQPRIYDTGGLVTWWDDSYQRESYIDVATAPDTNTLIRVIVADYMGETSMTLTCSQAVALMKRLQQAIDSIPEEEP